MDNVPNQGISEMDFFNVIGEASKQYEIYLELNNIASILDNDIPVETFQRAFDHPLGIQIKD
jgi:hypothetical protein